MITAPEPDPFSAAVASATWPWWFAAAVVVFALLGGAIYMVTRDTRRWSTPAQHPRRMSGDPAAFGTSSKPAPRRSSDWSPSADTSGSDGGSSDGGSCSI